MASRITIRRAGCFLPFLCLTAIVFLFCLLGWLSTVGLPDCALRALEHKAAEAAGVQVRIGNIRLKPTSGLAFKVYDVQVAPPAEGLPDITVGKAIVQYGWNDLMRGRYDSAEIELHQTDIIQPVTLQAGSTLALRDLSGTLSLRDAAGVQTLNARFTAQFEGIQLTLLARTPLPQAEETAKNADDENAEPIDFAAIAEQIAPTVLQVRRQLDAQHWERAPQLSLAYYRSPEAREHLVLRGTLPSYELWNDFHFRDAELDIELQDKIVTINKLNFRTVAPDTMVNLRGGYDMEHRALSAQLSSSASLVRLAEAYLDDDPTGGLLHRITHRDNATPHIELTADITMAEDYRPYSIRLRGSLEQQGFNIGEAGIDRCYLTFYYNNGDFNIDNFLLELPNKHSIQCAAGAVNGEGSASVKLDTPPAEILTLLNNALAPETPYILPADLATTGAVQAKLHADFTTAKFQPGVTPWADLIPELRQAELELSAEELRANGVMLQQAKLEAQLLGIELNARKLGSIALSWQSAAAEIMGHRTADTAFTLKAEQLGLNQDNAVALGRLNADLETGAIGFGELDFKQLHAHIDLPEGWDTARPWQEQIKGNGIQLLAGTITHGESLRMEGVELQVAAETNEKLDTAFKSRIGEDELKLHLPLEVRDDRVRLSETQLTLPLGAFGPLLDELGYGLNELELPPLVQLHIHSAELGADNGKLYELHSGIRIPELVRTPQLVPAFRGERVAVGLESDLHLTRNTRGELQTEGTLLVSHGGNTLEAAFFGEPEHYIAFSKGHNTIGVDVIDKLIDYPDAHYIMRDFHPVPGETRIDITDIAGRIDYDNYFCLDVTCHADLHNLEYLMGSMVDETDADGTETGEHLRTDMGKNPYRLFKHGNCGVHVQVELPEESGIPQSKDVILIELWNPVLTSDNRRWLAARGIKGGAAESSISGRSVIFDIENCTITLNKLKGQCYPGYTIAAFYDPIEGFLDTISLARPANVETDYCIFPIAASCEVPMRGLIRADVREGAGFSFIGTTFPLSEFSGFINISDTDVYLDRMNAKCWEGVLNAAVRIGFSGESASFDGNVQARGVNLHHIGAAYGTELEPALCDIDFRFRTPSAELNALQARGSARVRNGDLMQLQIFSPVGSLISDLPNYLYTLQQSITGQEVKPAEERNPGFITRTISWFFNTTGDTVSDIGDTTSRYFARIPFANHLLQYDLQNADAEFIIRNGHLTTTSMTATGSNLLVSMLLDLNLADLSINGNIWPRITSVPAKLLSPITILSDYMIDIILSGELTNVKWGIGVDRKYEDSLHGIDSSVSADEQ